jgi:citrate/tricarballylate utilization protein
VQPLEQLVAAAAAEAELARQLQICNACRYCEGYCAVFPAMARRLEFPPADLHYLANLCHHCGACLHACQYAPPHEFAVALPPALARVRVRSYARFAWPQRFGLAYERHGLVLALALSAALALVLALAVLTQGSAGALLRASASGSFYDILPHGWMVGLFGPVFAFALLALGVGVSRFWREVAPGPAPAGQRGAAVAEAARDALRLKYLDGGHGEGCHEEDERWTLARRRWHHLAFAGFALCFAATCVATFYHYGLGRIAPYGFTTLPKLLGVAGGVLLAAGSAGLWRLRRSRHPLHEAREQRPLDLGFMALLFLSAASGLALAALRTSAAMPLLLCLHLGVVLALFATLPYGKFAHGAYRVAALLNWAIERRQPPRNRLAEGT